MLVGIKCEQGLLPPMSHSTNIIGCLVAKKRAASSKLRLGGVEVEGYYGGGHETLGREGVVQGLSVRLVYLKLLGSIKQHGAGFHRANPEHLFHGS